MGVFTGPEIPKGDLDSSISTESASSIKLYDAHFAFLVD